MKKILSRLFFLLIVFVFISDARYRSRLLGSYQDAARMVSISAVDRRILLPFSFGPSILLDFAGTIETISNPPSDTYSTLYFRNFFLIGQQNSDIAFQNAQNLSIVGYLESNSSYPVSQMIALEDRFLFVLMSDYTIMAFNFPEDGIVPSSPRTYSAMKELANGNVPSSFGSYTMAFNGIIALFVILPNGSLGMLQIGDGTASIVSNGTFSDIQMTSDGKYLVVIVGSILGQVEIRDGKMGSLISQFASCGDVSGNPITVDLSNSSSILIYYGVAQKFVWHDPSTGICIPSDDFDGDLPTAQDFTLSFHPMTDQMRLIVVRGLDAYFNPKTDLYIISVEPPPSSSIPSSSAAIASSHRDPGIIAAAVIIPIFAIAMVSAIVIFLIYRKKINSPSRTQFQLENVTAASQLDSWKIRHQDITLDQSLGSGAHGCVYKGKWRNANVAIKQLKDENISSQIFLREALQMKELRNHANVCKFLGVVVEENYPVSIVTEFVENGSLWDAIKKGEIQFDYQLCVSLARDTAAGMAHIHEQGLLHCDLAARNLLFEKRREKLIVKVADFGLSHMSHTDTYDVNARMSLPIRWTAPEVFANHEFCKASDVWSFGVVMWEITEAALPYYTIPSNPEVIAYVGRGGRLPRPRRTAVSDDYYNLMVRCWSAEMNDRPTFKEIGNILDAMMPIEEVPIQEYEGTLQVRDVYENGSRQDQVYANAPKEDIYANAPKEDIYANAPQPLYGNAPEQT